MKIVILFFMALTALSLSAQAKSHQVNVKESSLVVVHSSTYWIEDQNLFKNINTLIEGFENNFTPVFLVRNSEKYLRGTNNLEELAKIDNTIYPVATQWFLDDGHQAPYQEVHMDKTRFVENGGPVDDVEGDNIYHSVLGEHDFHIKTQDIYFAGGNFFQCLKSAASVATYRRYLHQDNDIESGGFSQEKESPAFTRLFFLVDHIFDYQYQYKFGNVKTFRQAINNIIPEYGKNELGRSILYKLFEIGPKEDVFNTEVVIYLYGEEIYKQKFDKHGKKKNFAKTKNLIEVRLISSSTMNFKN